jgi:hypothetical protein
MSRQHRNGRAGYTAHVHLPHDHAGSLHNSCMVMEAARMRAARTAAHVQPGILRPASSSCSAFSLASLVTLLCFARFGVCQHRCVGCLRWRCKIWNCCVPLRCGFGSRTCPKPARHWGLSHGALPLSDRQRLPLGCVCARSAVAEADAAQQSRLLLQGDMPQCSVESCSRRSCCVMLPCTTSHLWLTDPATA